MAALTHRRLGPYRLMQPVTQGSECQIWSAVDERDGARCVLKLFAGVNREIQRTMRHEFEVGRSVRHPQLLAPRDLGEEREVLYLVMDWYPSRNLKELIGSDREFIRDRLHAISVGAAEALSQLHRGGWIHRDIKPENFLVNDEAEVKLIDFALAERPRRGLLGWLRGRRIQGTRSYLSPEQIRRRSLDARSDVYSFGCTLYHLAAGTAPYTGANSNELLTKHLKAAVPRLDVVNSEVSADFSLLVASMMAKNPGERPGSMEYIVHLLRASPIYKQNLSCLPAQRAPVLAERANQTG